MTSRFDIQGLEPESYELSARKRGYGESEPYPLLEDSTVEDLRLVLNPWVEREGVVLGPDGPVSGANIELIVAASSSKRVPTATDVTGSFRCRLPPDLTAAVVLVMAPARFIWSGRITIPEQGRLVVQLPAGPSGRVSLQLPQPDGSTPPVGGPSLFLVTSDGGLLTMSDLISRGVRFLSGSAMEYTEGLLTRLHVDRLAPRRYALM